MSKATDHSHSTNPHGPMIQDPDESWAQDMKEQCKSIVQRVAPFTIFRVPESICQADKGSYKPKILSIGPYHYRAEEQLAAMEKQKWRNLERILSGEPEMRLVDFLKEIKILEGDIRKCYSEIINVESKELVEMMVLDGCFIITILLSLEGYEGLDQSHPIYESRWVWPNLVHDILLLENQIPFFVLDRLFHLIPKPNSSATDKLEDLALKFFDVSFPRMKRTKEEIPPPTDRCLRLDLKFCDCLMPRKEEEEKIPPLESVHHLLHLFHWHHRLSNPESNNFFRIDFEREPLKMIPPAREITRVGIKLRKDERDMLNVKFRDNVLLIPPLHLNYQTFSLLRNLIALEQCSFKYGTDFTSYAFFMDCLIDTTEDVALLKSQLIIEHDLSKDDDVALLINRLCSGISFDIRDGYMSTIFTKVRKVYMNDWNACWPKLIRNYFPNLMDVINLELLIFTFYLTIMQTVFAVLSYRRGSN